MKTFLSFIFLLTFINSNAQFGTIGQKVVTGSLGINSGNNNSSVPDSRSTGTNLAIYLGAGKFYKKNVLTSITLAFINGKVKNTTAVNTEYNKTHAGYLSFAKTYFKQIKEKLFFGIAGNVSAGYQFIKNTNNQNIDHTESYRYSGGIAITPILSYQLTKRLMVNGALATDFLSLNYNSSTTKFYSLSQPTSIQKSESFNFDTGLRGSFLSNFSVGFSYLLK
jgi:hypothetical protein